MSQSNDLMLAQQMAQHYQTTLAMVRGDKYTRAWALLPKETQQDMIRTFQIILAASDEIALEENLKLRNPIKRSPL